MKLSWAAQGSFEHILFVDQERIKLITPILKTKMTMESIGYTAIRLKHYLPM